MRISRNILGLIAKLSAYPILLYIFSDCRAESMIGIWSKFPGFFLILAGLFGMMISDLLILRFGDGNLHLSPKSTRLVDVGFYARTRHPFTWFFTAYLFGLLMVMFGFSWEILIVTLLHFFISIIWLMLVQESLLARSLGQRYIQYKNITPLWYVKLRVPENRRVGLRPQLVWVLGMVVIRPWFRIQLSGTDHIPHDRPFLIVANHESYLDPFLFAIFIPYEIQFVTTADVFNTPLMRFLLKGTGSFPIRRHRQDLKSIRTMIRMIGNGQVVCIFPEGGRSTDGSPLPILKETLKLIQHCGVPILPVQLDGAYEVWPRWAPNRRWGQVTVSFKPVIPLDAQADLEKLHQRISAGIFPKEKIFRTVKSNSITRGMQQLLWACYKCHTRNSIVEVSGNSIACQHCAQEWQVTNDYHFIPLGETQAITSIQWIQMIKSGMLDHPLNMDLGFTLQPDEILHLHSIISKYVIEADILATDELELVLSNQRMLLLQKRELIHAWSIANITIFTMDYYNAISIGVGGKRHTFQLPHGEISLKWQTYFDELKENIDHPRVT